MAQEQEKTSEHNNYRACLGVCNQEFISDLKQCADQFKKDDEAQTCAICKEGSKMKFAACIEGCKIFLERSKNE